ncbi:hypothetical protein FOA52_015154 [Chlamydomonas sp. UWO 241]|nr:hypothetical protein FOA52_015154 [Chlamydomonas sp. UWO 241]
MSKASLVAGVVGAAGELTKELDILADRAFELQRVAQALAARECRLQSFEYLPFNKKLNWKRLRGMSIEKMLRSGDTRELMEMFNEVAQVGRCSEGAGQKLWRN